MKRPGGDSGKRSVTSGAVRDWQSVGSAAFVMWSLFCLLHYLSGAVSNKYVSGLLERFSLLK